MATFFVGQRVRIKWSEGWPELAGQEGRIVARGNGRVVFGIACEWLVAPDCWGAELAPYPGKAGGRRFAPNGVQLEPILPSGHQPCDTEFKRDLDRLLEGAAA